MYAQQYRQPPKDYCGTAMQPKEQINTRQPEQTERSSAPVRLLSSVGTDEILIAVIIFIVISSGGWEKNALLLMALVFILI